MSNKPYHLEIWDYLNELFQIDWEIKDYCDNRWSRESIFVNLEILDCKLIISFRLYWESGKIELYECYSQIQDINWCHIGKDMRFITMPTFETFDEFKEFIQYNYERFKPYLK